MRTQRPRKSHIRLLVQVNLAEIILVRQYNCLQGGLSTPQFDGSEAREASQSRASSSPTKRRGSMNRAPMVSIMTSSRYLVHGKLTRIPISVKGFASVRRNRARVADHPTMGMG